ncbi:gluconate 2-dehydrogenase subunit 3 family protein [Haloplanus aerogenes]|uniref:Gluconate 2-dehydrogenase subunit 3 family protein n=1 Tax=Haloplanus aerogenes TaxID=660522 RepID=A0A3M0CX80_9EURY|nr:gluconate 2-dehydrogenase subunit 3 family protein [Haloplanus aerogenes]AZH25010.1 gluconate 2-dehydrogenase subunit 3 family protein [Haloplanus aerogenes]RMB13772.1 gluconate 2-dehydrogenase subunit 3-like protein [Haloplanus aerogenes]
MNLSRRDALAALATAGAVGVAGATALGDEGSPDTTVSDDTLAILVAVAEAVYPAEAEGIEPFVETYVAGRIADDPAHREGVVTAAADLDATARDWRGAPLTDLDRSARDQLLRDLSVDVADPDPDGNLAAQVRFYLVNELLYAFYASPTGGRLVGIENPVGYPGGTESYQKARMEDEDG